MESDKRMDHFELDVLDAKVLWYVDLERDRAKAHSQTPLSTYFCTFNGMREEEMAKQDVMGEAWRLEAHREVTRIAPTETDWLKEPNGWRIY